MERNDREALTRFAREHHVHYDVETETADDRRQRRGVGFDVRLRATHEGEPLGVPGCRRCLELLAELRSFAEQALAPTDAASSTEIVPQPDVLFQSTDARDTDEVALTLRISRTPGDRHASTSDDPRLSQVRERLEAIGVQRRD